MPERMLDAAPLYAGEAVSRMPEVIGAEDAVRRLAGAAD
jgi:hypothetical protein